MEQEKTTIAAISTPLAPGGISVIRLSGPQAFDLAGKVFSPLSGREIAGMKGYTAAYGTISDASGEIDEGVLLVYRAPKSYTGEDVAEISCHGGVYVTGRVLKAVVEAGAKPAAPGEFTKRAFLNGKLSLTEAEGVADLISAQGEQGLRAARGAMKGALYRKIRAITDSLLGLTAQISAYIDYPDEEIDPLSDGQLTGTLRQAQEDLTSLLGSFETGKRVREGVETVIVGRPNVGKSTLMNLLSGENRSIVTPIPGTTRDVVEETVVIDGITLRLADTAGIRETKDQVEEIGVQKALERLETAGLILAVFDSSAPLDQEDERLIRRLEGLPVIAVCNKADLPNEIDLKYIKEHIQHIVEISARENRGLDALSEAVREVLSLGNYHAGEAVLANLRQFDCANRALSLLREARETAEAGYTLDAVDIALESVIAALLELTGERVTDAVVDQVFARFCVGK